MLYFSLAPLTYPLTTAGGGLFGPEVRRNTSGASGCIGRLQARELVPAPPELELELEDALPIAKFHRDCPMRPSQPLPIGIFFYTVFSNAVSVSYSAPCLRGERSYSHAASLAAAHTAPTWPHSHTLPSGLLGERAPGGALKNTPFLLCRSWRHLRLSYMPWATPG